MDLTNLETFVRVAETGSLVAAARALGLPKSTVSRRIAKLEAELGTALIHRAGRGVALTDAGRALHARCAPALREIAEVGRSLADRGSEPRGRLRITAPQDFGKTGAFASLLAAFTEAAPQVELEVELTNRVVDVIEEGFDVAFRMHVHPLPDSTTLVARQLGTIGSTLCASPAFAAREELPREPARLANVPCLVHAMHAAAGTWPLEHADGQSVEARPRAVLTANDFVLLLGAALAGAGVAALPRFVAARHLASGELVPVLAGWETRNGQLTLVWPRSRYVAPRLRAFVDFAVEHVRGAGWVRR